MVYEVCDGHNGVRGMLSTDVTLPLSKGQPIELVFECQETLGYLIRTEELRVSGEPVHAVHLVSDAHVTRSHCLDHVDCVLVYETLGEAPNLVHFLSKQI